MREPCHDAAIDSVGDGGRTTDLLFPSPEQTLGMISRGLAAGGSREGYERREAVLAGSELRLRPILMTSVTTTCALIPMALGLGAGAELQQPLAIAIIGGESTGTLLTLLVIPVVYSLMDRKRWPTQTAP